ncbi:alanine racemase [Nesterenkonia pannonica]|uniref:alanine racemase n=1 Tax=Nesterenkonia pannonica TaxID=1548602 RepID=UPI00216426A4|nr:alanine racemase [Nesterenkonia pannonica]
MMAQSMGADAYQMDVLLEIDSGHHRSGIAPEAAVAVAESAAAAGLHVAGIFTFPGHSYAPGMPIKAAEQEEAALAAASNLLTNAGFHVERLSGGSTPTATLTGPSSSQRSDPVFMCSVTPSSLSWNGARRRTLRSPSRPQLSA